MSDKFRHWKLIKIQCKKKKNSQQLVLQPLPQKDDVLKLLHNPRPLMHKCFCSKTLLNRFQAVVTLQKHPRKKLTSKEQVTQWSHAQQGRERRKIIDNGIINLLHKCLKVRFTLPSINRWSKRTTKSQFDKHLNLNILLGGKEQETPWPSAPGSSPFAPQQLNLSPALLKNTQDLKNKWIMKDGTLWGNVTPTEEPPDPVHHLNEDLPVTAESRWDWKVNPFSSATWWLE